MGDVKRLCSVCGKIAENACKACGAIVCDAHYDRKSGFCLDHAKGRRLR
jgi:hypothetical protein